MSSIPKYQPLKLFSPKSQPLNKGSVREKSDSKDLIIGANVESSSGSASTDSLTVTHLVSTSPLTGGHPVSTSLLFTSPLFSIDFTSFAFVFSRQPVILLHFSLFLLVSFLHQSYSPDQRNSYYDCFIVQLFLFLIPSVVSFPLDLVIQFILIKFMCG